MSPAAPLPDYVLDAAALGRLVVVTGAGVSVGLRRPNDIPLPNWGGLVQQLREQMQPAALSREQMLLLDQLLPSSALEDLHGDVLIEASEIIQKGFDTGAFQHAMAAICREKDGETSDTHRAIAKILPAGVITFNYDRAHECAFQGQDIGFQSIIYNEDRKLKDVLCERNATKSFVLKAHGCVTAPETLVLTSGAYREILSRNRVYRAFLQHILVQNTILIVGFAMRDRDFDQLLSTLEVEFGTPIQPHAFIAKAPDATRAGLAKRAEWAAVTARFGVEAIYVSDYAEIPSMIRSTTKDHGPRIRNLVARSTSRDRAQRASAHDEIDTLGPVGKSQVRRALMDILERDRLDLEVRSEVIYSLRGIGDRDPAVASRLLQEVEVATREFSRVPDIGLTECAAHALLVLRRSRLEQPICREIVDRLGSRESIGLLAAMDRWLVHNGGSKRLVIYARAAMAEITARSTAP